ncbi:MAG: hypothetical protein DCF23_10325 [Cyanobium sp.]|nr:MAG: hypothetical protein DCF23_10325 [Cyanobium sp.]
MSYGADGMVSSYVISEHNLNFDEKYTSCTINRGSASFAAKFIYLANDSTTPNPNPPPPPPPPGDARLALPIFDPAYYLATYADVRNAYGASNFEGAKSHWLQFGITEGRRGSLVFDPKYYLQQFQDVANAYGATNYAGAISHWLEWGLKFGRRGSVEFDPIYYMAAHPDVEQAYGVMNFSGAISHYYQWGKPGGWYGSEWITDSTAFQLGYYLANNADVKAVTNNANQEVEATRHWYFIGINEGRRGSPEFDAKFYLAKYEDVRAAFGANNYRGALDHYLLFGKAGGRIGADDTPRTLSINDVSIAEGNSGAQFLVFTVSLNIVTGEPVTVSYSAPNGTATDGSDYRAISGSLSFAPGETSKTISIEIFGDTTFESDETFTVNLSGSSNATIVKGQGVGTIGNDDPQIVNEGKATFSIADIPTVGQTLTASKTADDPDGNGSFTYLWQSSPNGCSWVNIGSNSPSQLLGFAEAGKQVRVNISYVDADGFAEVVAVPAVLVGRGVVRAAIVGISDNTGLIQGAIAPGGRTDDRTPTIIGTFSAPLVAGESVRIFNGTSFLGNAVVNNTTGTWSYTPTLPANAGVTYSITARVADAAGNLGVASAARTFFLDSTAPLTTAAISAVTDNVGIITGTVAAGGRTNDLTPTITGSLSAALASGETLRIFNGTTLLGSATVNNTTRTWSYTPTLPASAGITYSITARVADAAGNLGVASATRTFFLDSTAPLTTAAISAVTDNVGIITGTVAAGGRTNDLTPTITGSLSAALASGETLRIFNGTTLLGSATVNNTTRTWSYTPTLPASAGITYSITARVADAAGNLGVASATRTFFLDSTAPLTTAAISAVTDNVGIITGTVAAGGRTNDLTPTITGSLSAALVSGETLRIFSGTTLLGSATVNNTTKTWTYTPTLPASAGVTYSITARVADAAGNLGVASAARTFVLDTTAPAITSFSPLDGAIGVDPAANIVFNVSEAIQRGTGSIQLRVGSADGPITESFDAATSTRLSISGTGVTINPTSNLAPNTRYFLTFPAGSLSDRAGNPFAGTSSYDFRTTNVVSGGPASDILSFTSTVDRLTGLAGADTFRLSSLSHSRLPASPTTPIDRISDLVTGLDSIDAPLVRTLATAVNPVARGSVAELSATAIAALLTPANFPALTTTSTGGVASFTFNNPATGTRTFLAINDGVAGFSAATDSILEITGFSGTLNQLQIF